MRSNSSFSKMTLPFLGFRTNLNLKEHFKDFEYFDPGKPHPGDKKIGFRNTTIWVRLSQDNSSWLPMTLLWIQKVSDNEN